MSESDLDHLYQLPQEEFTNARNALARRGGTGAAAVRGLRKPPLAAWAVNQLYWRRRSTYDALIEAAESLRRTHTAVLGGRHGDLRSASKAHDEGLETAIRETLGLLRDGGHPASDATRQAIVSTLRALPTDQPPGRLDRVLQPGGFEMLSGMAVRGRAAPAGLKAAPAKTQGGDTKDENKRIAREREEAAVAARALREAEQTARREQFERARTARDAQKADKGVEEARADLERAGEALEQAEAAAATAHRALELAERRARDADKEVRRLKQ